MTAVASAAVLTLTAVSPLGALPAQADGPAQAPVNLALNGAASASSVELDRDTFAASQANDGSTQTRWSSKYVDDNWVQIKLARDAKVDHVTLVWPNACARDFAVQTSMDGATWTTVTRQQRATCPRTDEIDVKATARYVRMQGYQRWANFGYSISEFQVWDRPVQESLGIVPKPVSVSETGGPRYRLDPATSIAALGAGARAPAGRLAQVLRRSTGYRLPVVSAKTGPKPIVIQVGAGLGPAGRPEGYVLAANAAEITIRAATANGALNGVQTLRQLFPQWVESRTKVNAEWTVPPVRISDHPRFAHRGMMLDVARSFYPVNEVKKYIDTAAQFKINRLHLHLSDDQGWRIAIGDPADNPSGIDYGRLTSVSGGTAMTYNSAGQQMGTELGLTGYYTKADYAEIVRYAGANGMAVIPEIDMPGHTNAALHAIPQLNSEGSGPQPEPGQPTVPANGTPNVGYSSLDAANPATYEFTKHVLTEIAEMTPGPYLHIGGDESHSTGHANYTKMINAFTGQVNGLGKTVVAWNEAAGTALPQDNAVVQFWNGNRTSVAEAVTSRGAKVILSPAANTYVPQKQDSRQPQGGTWACGGVCGLDRHYGWDPGTFVPGIQETSVLGVESALWGEFIRRLPQAQYYSYPRLIATAEVGWTPQAQRDYPDFTRRLAALGGRLTVEGVNFFPTASVPWPTAATGTDKTVPAGSPAGATWTVTAPAAGDLTGTITWDDGVREDVTLTAERRASIPDMRANSTFTAVSNRTFGTPGTRTATLTARPSGGEPVEATLTVTVS
ncbi:family 20 glycosylhydrolase [Actinomadura sp. KC06]|uniref:family 20 glycosylhydrolase n=1 Tax=Actinomadura sp. KC06 TaxID=2530369 RepID=UPI001FB7830F|nr:family 20 glycosylhydrolase [Actinomadura sp. KC06]